MKTDVERARLRQSCLDQLAAGRATEDDLVHDLRDRGCSKIDSIVVLRDVLRISLAKAQMIVHLSPVWSDVREQDEALHDAFWAAIESIGAVGEGRSS
jgi:hypothetical protein